MKVKKWRVSVLDDKPIKLRSFYDRGLWTIDQVHFAVGVVITLKEYLEIAGEEYIVEV